MAARLRREVIKVSQRLDGMLAHRHLQANRSVLAEEANASLHAEGVWTSTVEQLLGNAAPAYRRTMADAAELVKGRRHGGGRTWHARGASTDLDAGDLLSHLPGLFMFGLHPEVLGIAEQYLRLPVAYHGAVLRHSLVDGNAVGPRLWHRDSEDRHVLRCVVYLTDVDEDSGPFEYVPRPLMEEVDARSLSLGGMRSCADVAALVPRERWRRVTGPAGTVVLADSAQVFHHESLQRRTDRSVVMMGHASRRPMNRALAESHFPVHEHLATLRRLVPPEHHAHVFGWREGAATPARQRASAMPVRDSLFG